MKASRHNGRSGKHGVYDVKHNDRDFDVEHSEHIDSERTKQNVYWDCYQGYSFAGSSQGRQFNFTEIERAYYYEHYSDFVDAQNERNEQARHPERNRTIDDVLKNNKTCPEESVIQLGNIDHAVTPDVLAKVSAEFFDEFNKRYGSHIHILDWALHLDEATPHIHERHVFDAKNKYGELCPQQDKALEELGFELPDPAKKKGKYNNRKMNFDAECRKLFLEIAQRNGVQVECEPVYGGAGYLEKQDFIIENQKKRIAEKQAVLDEITMRVLDMENFVEQVAEDAYEKACEAVSDTMAEQTRAEDIEELRRYKKWLTSDERKTPKDKRDFVGRCLDNLENRLRGMAQKVAGKVMETLQNPRIKEQKKSEVKEHARKSVRALLEANRKLVEEQRAKVAEKSKGRGIGISMNVFAVVKENVTARQVAMQYGIKINRSGLACCPFHKDKTPSMKIDKRYYCFGCGDTGDAIDFVAKYFGLAPKEAAMKIASDFGLNYDATNRAPPKKMAPKKTPEQILDEEQKQCFCVLSDYYHLLRKWKTEYAPKSMDEEWHPCFVEALQNISKVEYQLDTLLEKDIPDRASVVSDIGKGVKSIAGRIEEYRRSQGDAGEHRKGRSQENSR